MVISTAKHKPSLWLRYVDDTFVIWSHGKKTLDEFLLHLNSQRSSIEFTMEMEKDGTLPFLDVLVRRGHHGLTTTVYRKPTHTDRYLNFRSNHHPRIKSGIIKCLAHRARNICQQDLIQSEFNHLQHVFECNDYPPELIRRCLRKHHKLERDKIICLPYIKGLSESLERACDQPDIKFVFKCNRTLRSLLTKVKTKTKNEKIKGVV